MNTSFRHGNCGNCGYDCCCECKNPNCRPCKAYTGRPRSCSNFGTDVKYLCFRCRRFYPVGIMSSDYADLHLHPIHSVNTALRIPKHTDNVGWALLEKLITCSDVNDKPGTLGHYWRHNGQVCCARHAPDYIRKLIWVPRNQSEYRQWLVDMNQHMP